MKKPSRPDLKKKNLTDKEKIVRLEYLVDLLCRANKIEIDWQ